MLNVGGALFKNPLDFNRKYIRLDYLKLLYFFFKQEYSCAVLVET